jgi:tetratricopeptide (TPR) repeat protein
VIRAAAAALVALAPAVAHADVSAAIDALWDSDRPAVSEARFRARLASSPRGSREALELETQVARAQGLQRRFDAAHATLDAVAPALATAAPRVQVRYLLERGRVQNSSGAPAKAVPLFEEAVRRADADPDEGAEFYAIDALHMLGIVAPAGERLAWNLKALDAAERASDARARGWRASLLNNLGWTAFEAGDASAALGYWQRALAAREEGGDAARTRIARWTVARGLRAVGRLDEAERIQFALAAEFERDGAADGYVFEELYEIALARGDAAAARAWAARAYAELAKDPALAGNEPARLARLKDAGGAGTTGAR